MWQPDLRGLYSRALKSKFLRKAVHVTFLKQLISLCYDPGKSE